MECKNCGYILEENSVFCSKCGNRADCKKSCNACHQLISEDAIFCKFCGTRADGKIVCNCGRVLESDERFCIICGKKRENDLTLKKNILNDEKTYLPIATNISNIFNGEIYSIVKKSIMLCFVIIIFIVSFFSISKKTVYIPFNSGWSMDVAEVEVKHSTVEVLDAFIRRGYTERELMEISRRIKKIMDDTDFSYYPTLLEMENMYTAIFDEVNLYRLTLTDDKIIENVFSISDILAIDFQLERNVVSVEVAMIAILALTLIVTNVIFIIFLIYSLVKKRKTMIQNIAMHINLAISFILFAMIQSGFGSSIGIAIKVPLILSIIAMPLLITISILQNIDKLEVKSLVCRAITASLTLIILFIFIFGTINSVQIFIGSGVNKEVYTLNLRSFNYINAFFANERTIEQNRIKNLVQGYVLLAKYDLLFFQNPSSIFLSITDRTYYNLYSVAIVLFKMVPFLFLIVVGIMIFKFVSSLYAITENKNSKSELISPIIAAIVVLLIFIFSTILNATLNSTLENLSIDNMKMKIGMGMIIAFIFSFVLVFQIIVCNNICKPKNTRRYQIS